MVQATALKVTVQRAQAEHLVGISEINKHGFQGNRGEVDSKWHEKIFLAANFIARRTLGSLISAIGKTGPSFVWVCGLFSSYPSYHYFVILVDGEVAGYIGWQVHGGLLRPEPVLELEQIAIHPDFQGNGLAAKLISESRAEMCTWLALIDPIAQALVVVVWAYANNTNALKVYEKEFPDGIQGMRVQYDGRTEVMMRRRISLI